MRAAVLSIGDELVLAASRDTNAPWLAEQLGARGVAIVEQRTVGDDRARIAGSIRELARDVDVIISTGGLGPTDDDLTRDGLGDVVTPDSDLVIDENSLRVLERRYARAGRTMSENNRRQVMRPESASFMKNPHGTAPGIRAEVRGDGRACTVYALPGPPHEMMAMFRRFVQPELSGGGRAEFVASRRVHAYGLSESEAAERLGEILERGRNPLVGITVSDSILTARIRGVGQEVTVAPAVDEVAAEISRRWGAYAFGHDGQPLGASIGALMRSSGSTVATAESCTGGWLGKLIVDPAGSSDYYAGGWVTYTNEMKQSELGVDAALVEAHGAVSEPVASAMAEGARARVLSRLALAVTGIAGPVGGSDGKPVGTVFIGLAQEGQSTEVRRFQFPGDRTMVRDRSAKSALQMLRFRLMDCSESVRLIWERTTLNDA